MESSRKGGMRKAGDARRGHQAHKLQLVLPDRGRGRGKGGGGGGGDGGGSNSVGPGGDCGYNNSSSSDQVLQEHPPYFDLQYCANPSPGFIITPPPALFLFSSTRRTATSILLKRGKSLNCGSLSLRRRTRRRRRRGRERKRKARRRPTTTRDQTRPWRWPTGT